MSKIEGSEALIYDGSYDVRDVFYVQDRAKVDIRYMCKIKDCTIRVCRYKVREVKKIIYNL